MLSRSSPTLRFVVRCGLVLAGCGTHGEPSPSTVTDGGASAMLSSGAGGASGTVNAMGPGSGAPATASGAGGLGGVSGATPVGGAGPAAGGAGAIGQAGALGGTTAANGGRTNGQAGTPGGTPATSGGANAGGAGGALPSDITVWIAGDSTVANGQTPCPVGWGKPFSKQFRDGTRVVNSAVGGRSIRTWLYYVTTEMADDGECVLERASNGEPRLQDRWQSMLTGMKAGDYLLIQFGINDGSPTCDRHVGLAAFEESHVMMAEAARARGAHPIFLTPVSAVACSGGSARGTRGGYVDAVKRAGEQHSVPVIDLHARSVALYDELGFCPVPGGDVSASTGGAVGTFFCDDHTHFDTPGAERIAELVAAALREQGIALAEYLSEP